MKIETKFNVDDKIFFISNKKCMSTIIRGFMINKLNQEPMTITYLCNNLENERVNIKVLEEDAFKSKEELLKSL